MTYPVSSTLGAAFGETYLSSSTNLDYPRPPFTLGTRAVGNDGSEWIYVQAAGTIAVNSTVIISNTWTIAATTGAAAVSGVPNMVGFAHVAFAANTYGWVMLRGKPTILVAANTEVNVALWTTDTAGVLSSTANTASQYMVWDVRTYGTSAGASQTIATAMTGNPVIRIPRSNLP